MQVDIGKDRAEYCPLWCPCRCRLVRSFLHASGFEKQSDEMLEVVISYALIQTAHHPVMVDMVKESFNIRFDDPVHFSLHDDVIDFLQARMSIPVWSVSV